MRYFFLYSFHYNKHEAIHLRSFLSSVIGMYKSSSRPVKHCNTVAVEAKVQNPKILFFSLDWNSLVVYLLVAAVQACTADLACFAIDCVYFYASTAECVPRQELIKTGCKV